MEVLGAINLIIQTMKQTCWKKKKMLGSKYFCCFFVNTPSRATPLKTNKLTLDTKRKRPKENCNLKD